LNRLPLHLSRDRRAASASRAVNARPGEKVRLLVGGQRKQFIDIAFAVADMNTAVRINKLSRLFEILQPADALFLLNRNARGVDRALAAIAALQCVGALELLAGPKFNRG
jgi:hypothetical protein